MPKGKISKKQQEILDFMKKEILEKGYPPAVRQICEAVNLKSTSSVHAHLESLEKNGYIKKDATKPRAIEILDEDFQEARLRSLGLVPESSQTATLPTEFTNVPVIGHVAAGQPLLAVESIESYFPMPVDKLPNAETFMLKVQGESMINAGIFNGDYVLVEKRSTARNGEMIVALIEDSATVKTYYKENGYYRLQPENDYMEPIIVQGELQILGKVIGVFRFL
ncbi:MAG: transcriptional repressor LexA [Lachnospiraceae bacterium]|nr:transcriptional repressor LexA [Lachnospiraceae bacterium]